MALQQGQLVWAWISGLNKTARRACVVITSTPDGKFLEVVYGQGTAWRGCSCPVAVDKDSVLGERLKLSKETHFCGMQVIPAAAVTRVLRDRTGSPLWCPVSEFGAIEAVAVEARRVIARRAAAAAAAAQAIATPPAPNVQAAAPAAPAVSRTPTPQHVDPPAMSVSDQSDD